MSKLRAWAYGAVFIAAVGAGVFLGKWLEANMPDCPLKRFAPAVFGGVFGISMMVLIALCDHGKDSRSRDRAARPAPAEADRYLGTLDIYADFRFDLVRYETGEISLGQFLDRWAGRVPPKPNGPVKDKNPVEDQAMTLLGMLANSSLAANIRFKGGQWVRVKPAYRGQGLLGQIIGRSRLEGRDEERYEIMTIDGQMELGAYALEPALPKMGEWWLKERCGRDDAHGGTWLREPVFWPSNFQISMAGERAALCGCYHPVNFGKGKPTVPAQPSTYRPGQWVRYKGNSFPGALMKMLSRSQRTPLIAAAGEFYVEGEDGPLVVRESALMPAYPVRGEWWEKRDCPKVHKLPVGHGWIQGPWLWSQDGCDAVEREAVECGCLAPWNYGRPPCDPKNAPPGPGNNAGGIYANGGAGGSGNCALIPPGDDTGSLRTE